MDGLILNDEEARMLTQKSNLIQAAQMVLEMGPRYVILKKGEHGAFIMGKDVHFSLPAYPVTDVVDPTGAGDCFAGGVHGQPGARQRVGSAALRPVPVLFSTVTASFCVQELQHQLGLPRRITCRRASKSSPASAPSGAQAALGGGTWGAWAPRKMQYSRPGPPDSGPLHPAGIVWILAPEPGKSVNNPGASLRGRLLG
ncbi:MAG: PfkB family carbohydrate kinase [Planctomycetota bacterium]